MRPAEIRSLSLFLRFKLEVIEGRKEALGKSVVCALNVKKPGLAAPHRVEMILSCSAAPT